MTIDERLDRIEHLTAGLDEERRRDRDEYKSLWRDTQRQIGETQRQIEMTQRQIREADERLGKRIEELGEAIELLAVNSRTADARLGERIESLVGAFGAWLAKQGESKQ